MVWLAAIALNLLTTGRFFDVAVRDLEMAIAAFTLACLTEGREPVPVEGTGLRSAPNVLDRKASA